MKQIENCVFNSMWVKKCFGVKPFESVKKNAVICSGSTYGSFSGIQFYVRTMLASFDEVIVLCYVLRGFDSKAYNRTN